MNRVIVISREYASGGSEIGRRLADRLGVPFYDRKFVDAAVKDSGLPQDFVRQEERKFISSLLFNLSTGGYRYANDHSMSDQLHIAESNVLKNMAAQGDCVIVGRCADYILRDEAEIFSVYIHADMTVRVKRCVEEYGMEPRRLEQTIREKDRERPRHYEYYTDRTWGDRSNYHLSVNAGRLGIDEAVDVIRRAYEATETKRTV